MKLSTNFFYGRVLLAGLGVVLLSFPTALCSTVTSQAEKADRQKDAEAAVSLAGSLVTTLRLTPEEELHLAEQFEETRIKIRQALEDKLVQQIEGENETFKQRRENLYKLLAAIALMDNRTLRQDESVTGGGGDSSIEVMEGNPEALSQLSSILEAIFTGNVNLTSFRQHTGHLVPPLLRMQIDNLIKFLGGNTNSSDSASSTTTKKPDAATSFLVEFEAVDRLRTKAKSQNKPQSLKRSKNGNSNNAVTEKPSSNQNGTASSGPKDVGILEVILGKEKFNMTDFLHRRLPALYKSTKGAVDYLEELGVIDYDLIRLPAVVAGSVLRDVDFTLDFAALP